MFSRDVTAIVAFVALLAGCSFETSDPPKPTTGPSGAQWADAGAPPPTQQDSGPAPCFDGYGKLTLINNANEAVNILVEGPARYPYQLYVGDISRDYVIEVGRYIVVATGALTNSTLMSQIIDVTCNSSQTFTITQPPENAGYPELVINNTYPTLFLDVIIDHIYQNSVDALESSTYVMPPGKHAIEIFVFGQIAPLVNEVDDFAAGTSTQWTFPGP